MVELDHGFGTKEQWISESDGSVGLWMKVMVSMETYPLGLRYPVNNKRACFVGHVRC